MAQRSTVTDPRTWPPEIRARYGVTGRRRWLLPAACLGVMTLVLLGFLAVRLLNPAISSGLASFGIEADDHVHLGFAVSRPTSEPATCVVRARAADGFDVGYAVVSLPPAAGHTSHSYELRTAYKAILGELLGCAVGDQPPANVAPAQFRAGVVPPEQPWTAAAG